MGRKRKGAGKRKGRKIYLFIPLSLAVILAISLIYFYSPQENTSSNLPDLGKAPEFKLTTLSGQVVSLKDFRGKPTILWFMAAWCPSCVSQAETLKTIKERFGDDVVIIAIDLWVRQVIGEEQGGIPAEDVEDLIRFKERYGSDNWIWALDTDGVTIKYGITAVDSTVVISPDGRIVYKHMGPTGVRPLLKILNNLLGIEEVLAGVQEPLYPRGCGCL